MRKKAAGITGHFEAALLAPNFSPASRRKKSEQVIPGNNREKTQPGRNNHDKNDHEGKIFKSKHEVIISKQWVSKKCSRFYSRMALSIQRMIIFLALIGSGNARVVIVHQNPVGRAVEIVYL